MIDHRFCYFVILLTSSSSVFILYFSVDHYYCYRQSNSSTSVCRERSMYMYMYMCMCVIFKTCIMLDILQILDLKICLTDMMYQDSIVLHNRLVIACHAQTITVEPPYSSHSWDQQKWLD